MRILGVLVLVLALVACGDKSSSPCDQVGAHSGELAAQAEVDPRAPRATTPEQKQQLAVARAAVVSMGHYAADKCDKEQWPKARIDCTLAATTRAGITACK